MYFNNLNNKSLFYLKILFKFDTFGTNTKQTVDVVQITIKNDLRKYENCICSDGINITNEPSVQQINTIYTLKPI